MPLIETLTSLAQHAPLALLASVALFGLAYQTKRLSALQDQLLALAMATTSGPDARAPNLGQLAVALTNADAADVRKAVAIQLTNPSERLGSILVRTGTMRRKDLVRLLSIQDVIKRGQRPALSVARAYAEYARAAIANKVRRV